MHNEIDDGDRTPSDVVGRQIQVHRDRLGITREQLAEECAKLGAPQLTFAALTNIETGRKNPKTGVRRREISVDELLVIAYALAVPPLLLLFPLEGPKPALTPPHWKGGLNPYAAWRWAMGEEPPGHMQEDGQARADFSTIAKTGKDRFEAWREVVYPVELYRSLRDAEEVVRARKDAESRAAAFVELAKVLDQMIKAGISVPAYTSDWAEEIRATGVIRHPQALQALDPEENE
ncbi:helix-turn-helix domain-containing protein [Nonomuraea sp. KM90]|uniref:helix-turn-helix domain-containing protein n=1 Tax=Nonomuraea sp. KM90 TaxID=3457428 RepID=UPI003FCD8166